MFIRMATWADATNIDGGIEYLKGTALPVFHQQKGYRGLSSSVDRSGGTISVLSLWDSEGDRDASEGSMDKARNDASAIIGGTMSVERLEQMVLEVVTPPSVGSALMVTPFSMDPANIDDNIAFFKSEIVPPIKSAPGFCAVRNMIVRSTGTGYTGTTWADRAALDAQAEGAADRREIARRRGITFGEIGIREIVLIDTP
jgi:hypothetical protein